MSGVETFVRGREQPGAKLFTRVLVFVTDAGSTKSLQGPAVRSVKGATTRVGEKHKWDA